MKIKLLRTYIQGPMFYFLFVCAYCCAFVAGNPFDCNADSQWCESIRCPNSPICPSGLIFETSSSNCHCCGSCRYFQTNETVSNCYKDQRFRKELLSNDKEYAPDLWIPECNTDGTYKRKQRKNHKNICMDEHGKRIFGEEVGESSKNMSCRCSLLHSQRKDCPEQCTSSGDFQELQCVSNLCYCANPNTGEVESRIVHKDHLEKLLCYKEGITGACVKERMRYDSVSSHFKRKGVRLVGLQRMRCDPDGTFSASQCDDVRCSCTDKYGLQLKSFFTEDVKKGFQMVCECARDFGTLRCDSFGHFNRTQCFRMEEEECFCVDDDGDIVSRRFPATALTSSFCTQLIRPLQQSL